MKQKGFKVNDKKIIFARNELEHLEFRISRQGINITVPITKKQLRNTIGSTKNYINSFIKYYV